MDRTERVGEVEATVLVYVMRSAFAILLVLAFQLVGSALIDHYGLLGQSPIALSWTRLLGLGLLIGGAVPVVTDREAINGAVDASSSAE